ncbi:leucine-rich repeat and immunoglobulin-like domain-containing nogo receptor-interacting protein 2 isoform X3 [Acyrthosiphon pisum]|uniref:Ig-like domain-containing protein n=1 Tax=Acyrthosiphon pisum TaxID=7029 RepID=A0A8R2H6N9_ACYPI|nr:leucine-rich repeat and immunoglobulin-like domain-containing nogo receptor-interacting protein 2 isoform X3 [Acyrthosiphon pisum]|eukprot:XP_016658351.1 PREDICTED: leucine-rich repeat and immunoglobulin-like domain-containing nogo receptor-interacting protein 2 isoform X3 [Acyrthosiphon pisum]
MTLPMHQDAAAAAAAVLRRTRMILLLLLLMFSLSSFPSVTAECPEKCLCIEEIFFCHKKGLDRIPDRIPPAIKVLDLSYNEIMDIESLAHLTELETLIESYFRNLSNNNISELKHGAFANLSKLQSLLLNGNKFENIETGVFNNLTSLEFLLLHENNIHKLDSEIFKGLTKLYKLTLNNNNISEVKNGAFANLSKLQILNLSNSNISEVKNGAFANLSKLQTLLLNGNKIENIETGVFNNLTSLDSLSLHDNNIHKLDSEMFKGLTRLFKLMLSNNNISELKHGGFANLSELQILYLDNNKIENIETGAFNNLTSLKVLHLDYNNIHKLDLEMFKGLRKLDKLFLDHNMIRHIPPGTIDSLTSLSLLWLDHNPLTCDCNILLFVNVLKKSYPQRDVLWDNDPSCHFPVEMKEKSLKEITKNDFNCTSPDVIVVPENKTVSVGEQLQLSCKVVGDPEPYITWAKDDIDLELGKRVQVFQNHTLIISKVETTDGGKYKCVASNYLGRKSFEAMVNVIGLAENGCNTVFGVTPCFFFIIIILANCLLYNDIL